MRTRRRRTSTTLGLLTAAAGLAAFTTIVLLAAALGALSPAPGCPPPAGGIALLAPGAGATVGATEYGGLGDPSSGHIGASGADLNAEPDSYAELGGTTFATATALGGLPYGTPLRITWAGHSVIAYKRDIGLGGGPVAGRPRAIDLWWRLAGALGNPDEDGRWSGPVRVQRPPQTGAADTLGQIPGPAATPVPGGPGGSPGTVEQVDPFCPATGPGSTDGPRATIGADGLAAAPADAPAAVRAMIAAGNQIVGRPYVYGGGHGLPLSEIAPSYDCSSSVDHLLWGAGLLPATADATSGELASWGLPGPGRWVTLYANAGHTFLYVAGIRWDTWNAAGPQDGTPGIGWHPLVRDASGFVARHPAGL